MCHISKYVVFTPQHRRVGDLWYVPIYIVSMVHMPGDYVTRHVPHRSSKLDPEKYISPVSPDLTSKSSRDSIVNSSRRFSTILLCREPGVERRKMACN